MTSLSNSHLIRRELPKKQPRPRASRADTVAVIAEIRRAETTVAQAARLIGCDPANLERRVWKETKFDVFARDHGCLVCGSKNEYMRDAHHRRARKAGGTSDPAIAFGLANLVELCRVHHSRVEQYPDWARSLGLRLDDGDAPAATRLWYRDVWVLLDDAGGITRVGGGL